MNMPPSQTSGDSEPHVSVHLAHPHLEVDSDKARISLLLQLDSIEVMNDTTHERLKAIGFTPKAEFHVTALDIKPGSIAGEVFNSIDAYRQSLIMDALLGAHGKTWHVTSLDSFYSVEKLYAGEELPRKSIIQLVECPELIEFYTDLNQRTGNGIQFETPPVHITLATQGSSRGIGIRTVNELTDFGTFQSFADIQQ